MKKSIKTMLSCFSVVGLLSANNSFLLWLISRAVDVKNIESAEFVLCLAMATFTFFVIGMTFITVVGCLWVVFKDDNNKKYEEKEGNKVEQEEKDY